MGDVADAHAAAVARMADSKFAATYNIGTGQGTSVLEVMQKATTRLTGVEFSWEECLPRPGDPAQVVADAAKIEGELSWRSKYDLDSIIESAWNAWSR